MGGQYRAPKSGLDAFKVLLDGLQQQINAIRSAASISSAVISDPVDGSRMFLGNGNILLWDDYATNPDGFGRIYTDPIAGQNYMRWFPPHSAGDGQQNSVTMRGSAPGMPGAFWVYTDGPASLNADGIIYLLSGGRSDITTGNHSESVTGTKSVTTTGRHTLNADGGIDILTNGSMRLYELPTTGSAANIRLDPTTVELQYIPSSRRYKDDIADAVVEPREVLQLQPRTWVDKGTVDRAEPGTDITRSVGFIAEELDELPSMRQFVDYAPDEDGTPIPESIQYDRLTVALFAVVKEQQSQIDALTARLEALENLGA